jgi:hypothetical protein
MDTLHNIRNRLIAAKAPIAKIEAAIVKLSIAKQLDAQAKKEAREAWASIHEHLQPSDESLLDWLEDATGWANATQIAEALAGIWAHKTVCNTLRRLVLRRQIATRKEKGRLREYASLSRAAAELETKSSPSANVIWRKA